MTNEKRILALLFGAVVFGILVCPSAWSAPSSGIPAFSSYRDIPGITEDEIRDIEALKERYDSFTYGMIETSEAFIREDGSFGGYQALVCEWLGGLFGIPFRFEIIDSGTHIPRLSAGEIDFSGNVMRTPERELIYSMTDAIVDRQFVIIRLEYTHLDDIARERPVRFAFIPNTPGHDVVALVTPPDTYETVWVDNFPRAYQALINGDADGFIVTSAAESFFIGFDNIVIENFYPLIFNPISIATAKPELEPIINVISKALRNGGRQYLNLLHNRGRQEYTKHRLSVMLNDEERAYIADNPVVPVAAFIDNYPLTFYNHREREWQGIYFDLLGEVTELTGLRFHVVHDEYAEWPAKREMLENGEAVIMLGLTGTAEWEKTFDWSETLIQNDHYALISKSEYPSVSLNDIMNTTVGVVRNTTHADLFRLWFPNHPSIVEFNETSDAFAALQNDEVDVVMNTQSGVLGLTHFQELVGYRANFVFGLPIEARIAVNKNETALRSIVDKALRLTNVEGITSQWMQRTYDYRLKISEAQRPWLISATTLSLVVLALILVILIRERRMTARLKVAIDEAHEASRAKSDFLAKMSHEIRTPMNAIIGLTELTFREDTLDAVLEHTAAVKRAGVSLLSIIDDILDFSRIEAGNLEIVPKDYYVSSLINHVTGIIRTRVNSARVCFAVNVDGSIPKTMFGDETRIGQALLNVLNNACKYTEEGFVSFSVRGEFIDEDTINLIFKVVDSGRGIKEEDMENLFDDFTQFDVEKNKNTEGVGLGLAITRSLVEAMDGSISVSSEHGEGSTFTITLPQKYHSRDPLAAVSDPEAKNVLLCERRAVYADSIAYCAGNLGVRCTVASSEAELFERLESSAFGFLFISLAMYRNNRGDILKYADKVKVVVISDYGEDIPDRKLIVLSMPAYCAQVADILNDASRFSYRSDGEPAARFTAPDAKVLVVDDMGTNLKVAQGLMLPYNMRIDLCKSGKEAVKAIESKDYDLVFMDHKMPGMDGVVATQLIREMGEMDPYFKNVPIVALTANAVSGIRDMLLEKGFDDFLSKPIDMIKLNDILERWIPGGKQINPATQQAEAAPRIDND